MKVRFLLNRYAPLFGGHAVQLRQIFPRLQAAGIDLEVWTPQPGGCPASEVIDGVPVWRYGPAGETRARRYARTLHLMAATFFTRDCDIIHHAGVSSNSRWALAVAALAGSRQILQMTLLGSDDPESVMNVAPKRLLHPFWHRVDRWIALSTAMYDAALRTDLDPARVVIIPVGVDLERCRPADDRTEVRRRLGLPLDRPIVITVGAIIHRKGYDLILEAAARVAREMPEVLYVWVGPTDLGGAVRGQDAYLEGLKRRITELELTDSVRMVGESDDVPSYLQAADIFAFPSRGEGLPNAVMEASGTGLPVVMSALPGISTDLIREGETGFIVPQEDAAALAGRLKELLRDPALRASMGAAGRESMRDRFDMPKVVEQYLALYRELMA